MRVVEKASNIMKDGLTEPSNIVIKLLLYKEGGRSGNATKKHSLFKALRTDE